MSMDGRGRACMKLQAQKGEERGSGTSSLSHASPNIVGIKMHVQLVRWARFLDKATQGKIRHTAFSSIS